MKLRQIEKNDYNLILELDDKVYPVSKENKISHETIDKWYNKYPKYGMIYINSNCTDINFNNIVAMAIVIPMPISIWNKLIKGECFENTLNIDWENINKENFKNNEDNKSIIIGIHIYHIEVLNRDIVGKGFYKRMLQDISQISNYYNHQIEGLSGYCVTPKGNRLFQDVLKCKNADDLTYNNNKEYKSEFIVENPIDGKIKIVECPLNTEISKPYIDKGFQPPKEYKFVSKCNMLYTIKKDENESNSPVWNYL